MIIQQSALIHIAANSKDQFVSQLLTNPREIELKRSFILSQYWLFFIPFFSTNELTFGIEKRSNVLLILLSLKLTIDSFQNNIIITNYKNKQLMSGFNYKIQSERARNLVQVSVHSEPGQCRTWHVRAPTLPVPFTSYHNKFAL